MTGLTDRAAGDLPVPAGGEIEAARERWAESMQRLAQSLRGEIQQRSPTVVADCCDAVLDGSSLTMDYWGRPVVLAWPELEPRYQDSEVLPAFDTGMLLYYLSLADGTPPAGRWISFRELPGGAFYHLAYQRYSGDRLAGDFGLDPAGFASASGRIHGEPLSEFGAPAFSFRPLPRILLAAILWPGDEDFPSRGAIVFDAAASHYMTTDGLGLLAGGLAARLARAWGDPT